MRAEQDRDIVLKLVVILAVVKLAEIVPASDECALHEDGWSAVDRDGTVVGAHELEACFVDDARTIHLRVAELEGLVGVAGIDCLALERELVLDEIVLRLVSKL